MADDLSRGQEYAERPKEGELWQQMIERQQREGSAQSGYSRELLRSLPQEQQEDKDRGDRGDMAPNAIPLMAETQSYDDMLRQAAQRAMPDRERGLER